MSDSQAFQPFSEALRIMIPTPTAPQKMQINPHTVQTCGAIAAAFWANGTWSNIDLYHADETAVPMDFGHYAGGVLEGMTAQLHHSDPNVIVVIGAEMHYQRMIEGSRRMLHLCLPRYEDFLDALRRLLCANAEYLKLPAGWKMYIRPAVAPFCSAHKVQAPTSFLFTISMFPVPVAPAACGLVQELEVRRCAPGGHGNVKAFANYAEAVRARLMFQNNEAYRTAAHPVLDQAYFDPDAELGNILSEGSSAAILYVDDTRPHFPFGANPGTVLDSITIRWLNAYLRAQSDYIEHRARISNKAMEAGDDRCSIVLCGNAIGVVPVAEYHLNPAVRVRHDPNHDRLQPVLSAARFLSDLKSGVVEPGSRHDYFKAVEFIRL